MRRAKGLLGLALGGALGAALDLALSVALGLALILALSALPPSAQAEAFSPMLLSEFAPEVIAQEAEPQKWLVSEKLDGVRGLWDGERMYFRSGKALELPKAFTQGFPPFALDGELYSPKLHFSQIISILKNPAKHEEILALDFYVFDVPFAGKTSSETSSETSMEASSGASNRASSETSKIGLSQRLSSLEAYLKSHAAPHIRIIPQTPLASLESLSKELEDIAQKGGEGLVVRADFEPYHHGRSKRDFKLKKSKDSECELSGYSPGKGKYEGMVGALICQWGEKSFKIGSGLSDELRRNPPPLGSMISFKYHDLTHNGVPRFPRFWRVRESE